MGVQLNSASQAVTAAAQAAAGNASLSASSSAGGNSDDGFAAALEALRTQNAQTPQQSDPANAATAQNANALAAQSSASMAAQSRQAAAAQRKAAEGTAPADNTPQDTAQSAAASSADAQESTNGAPAAAQSAQSDPDTVAAQPDPQQAQTNAAALAAGAAKNDAAVDSSETALPAGTALAARSGKGGKASPDPSPASASASSNASASASDPSQLLAMQMAAANMQSPANLPAPKPALTSKVAGALSPAIGLSDDDDASPEEASGNSDADAAGSGAGKAGKAALANDIMPDAASSASANGAASGDAQPDDFASLLQNWQPSSGPQSTPDAAQASQPVHADAGASGATAANAAPDTSIQPSLLLSNSAPSQIGTYNFAGQLASAGGSQAGAASTPAQQIAVQIQSGLKAGDKQMTVQLHPEDMGRVDVKLDFGANGQVNATISADHQQTLDLLKQDQGALQKSLQDAGFDTSSGSLSFSLRDDQPGNGFTQMGGGQSGQGGYQNQSPRYANDDNDSDVISLVSMPRQLAAGRIDVTI